MGLRSIGDSDRESTLQRPTLKITYVFVVVIILVELVWPDRIRVSWPLVALIGILVVIPYLPLVKRISYGDLEAELESTLRNVEESVNEQNFSTENSDIRRRSRNMREYLYGKADNDLEFALSRLRSELTRVVKTLADERDFDRADHPSSFEDSLEFLRDHEDNIVDQGLYLDILDVYHITTETAFGHDISKENAQRIIRVGIRVLEHLYDASNKSINPDPDMPPFYEEE
ncbi:hypothetical protein [Haloterrigena alkaliphila]|uniref:Uncharacterized protein n=1 Tax=Haloterrigena alkaliphila TaxID=2816475 RepID=A0A8A2VFS0_9EURY|nr:hypothetical protein [Haloterrigena alkaliphila]QSX00890.1 hypothetical protein J0X25_08005 [Haloterrigena alkaliphila]